MKFWCASSRRVTLSAKLDTKSNGSLSSCASYETVSSIPIQKSDSGYSEITYSYLEQILVVERTHHENLKKYIIKYSRPLRRYLNPSEIVDLFQNIEKVSSEFYNIKILQISFRFLQYRNQLFVNLMNMINQFQ